MDARRFVQYTARHWLCSRAKVMEQGKRTCAAVLQLNGWCKIRGGGFAITTSFVANELRINIDGCHIIDDTADLVLVLRKQAPHNCGLSCVYSLLSRNCTARLNMSVCLQSDYPDGRALTRVHTCAVHLQAPATFAELQASLDQPRCYQIALTLPISGCPATRALCDSNWSFE